MVVSAKLRLLPAAGVVAAVAFTIVVNALAMRHYRRFDVTTTTRHALSPATLETLRTLPGPVELWILLGKGEPLFESIRNAAETYRGHNQFVRLHVVDPDRDLVQFEELRRRFRLNGGSVEGGAAAHGMDDVALVVERGERRHFVERGDLMEVDSVAAGRVRPREERALTAAIRSVLRSERTRLCFTDGHGEPSADDMSARGVGAFAEVLRRDNYEVARVDTTLPGAHEPFRGCSAVVVATPRRAFTTTEAERLRTYLLEGGSALVAISPSATKAGVSTVGLDVVLAPFGLRLESALVVEGETKLAFPESRGTRFLAGVRAHPVTAPLADEGAEKSAPPPIVVELVRPLGFATEPGAAAPVPLLTTSDRAFAPTALTEETAWNDVPVQGPTDLPGPLLIAAASERAKLSSSAHHGPRLVVVGTHSVLSSKGGGDPLAYGAAVFAEGAIAWLTANPLVLDVPERPTVTTAVRLTSESIAEVRRYVVFLIPLTFAFLGALVTWSRRRGRAARGGPA